jgi:hypothetical protein
LPNRFATARRSAEMKPMERVIAGVLGQYSHDLRHALRGLGQAALGDRSPQPQTVEPPLSHDPDDGGLTAECLAQQHATLPAKHL